MGWYSCWLSGQAVGYVALKKNWKKDSNGEKAVGSKGKERKGKEKGSDARFIKNSTLTRIRQTLERKKEPYPNRQLNMTGRQTKTKQIPIPLTASTPSSQTASSSVSAA
jgi:hypothetical protein